MKRLLLFGLTAAATTLLAVPVDITSATLTQISQRVTLSYALDAAAIVTCVLQSSSDGGATWTNVDGQVATTLSGDVWSLQTVGVHRITWKPWLHWKGTAPDKLRVTVQAWADDDPPDVLVADLRKTSSMRLAYYPSVDYLPGGLLTHPDDLYRRRALVARRIRARGRTFQRGSCAESGRIAAEKPCFTTLDHDYYMSVFEVTAAQLNVVSDYDEGTSVKPIHNISYENARKTLYPAEPGGSIAKFRARTGLAWDLSGEVEWEFAARGGYGEGRWNDGSAMLGNDNDPNLNRLARYTSTNGGGGWNGTRAAVGSYAPNDHGLYDMHGNNREICLDWYQEDVSWNTNGIVNASGAYLADGVTEGTNRVRKGGCYADSCVYLRPAYRDTHPPTKLSTENGLRLCLRIGGR